MVAMDLSSMIDFSKEDKKKATNQELLTRTGVAKKLQGGMSGKVLITSDEHGRLMSQQTAFHLAAVETIRRELVHNGIVIGNLANETKHQRIEITRIQRLGYAAADYIYMHIRRRHPGCLNGDGVQNQSGVSVRRVGPDHNVRCPNRELFKPVQ